MNNESWSELPHGQIKGRTTIFFLSFSAIKKKTKIINDILIRIINASIIADKHSDYFFFNM